MPYDDLPEARALLGDLCRHLSEIVHISIRPHRAPSPAALASAFGSGRVDLAWVSPVLALTAPELEHAAPLVSSVRAGVAQYHSVLFTSSDAPLRSLSDLVGVRAAWVARTSAAGFLVPRLALAARGLPPDVAFAEERFVDSHGAVARAVLGGEADVGATYAVFEGADPARAMLRSGFTRSVDGREGRVLLAVGPIPADLVIARPDVPITLRAALVTAFEALGTNAEAARSATALFGTDCFERFEAGALDPLREDVESGRALGLID